jgi:hypothetical protein
VVLGDRHERHTGVAVCDDVLAIDVQLRSSNLATLMPLFTRSTIKLFSNSQSHHHHHGATKRAAAVDVFPEADERDTWVIEFMQDFEEVVHRASYAVECLRQHVELPPQSAAAPPYCLRIRLHSFLRVARYSAPTLG